LHSFHIFLFFFHFYPAHPYLHSFPTRRSSDLMALLKNSCCMVAGDTGPLHLAIALGTPAVALFGPTDPTQRDGGSAERNRKVQRDRKSTRLNSSHVAISYAVFCLKKKKKAMPS